MFKNITSQQYSQNMSLISDDQISEDAPVIQHFIPQGSDPYQRHWGRVVHQN